MAYVYRKHYTREEARALLPRIREWMNQLQQLHRQLMKLDERIGEIMKGGNDAGGEIINTAVKTATATRKILWEFARRQIQIKDVDRGLIDFPSLRADQEVFLCWEMDEEDIEFWHELDAGYAGRERI